METIFGKARIYCRVAPNTTGGSGVIAAYDGENGTGNILWSWHIWVTDYAPDAIGNATILNPVNKRVLKFTYNTSDDQPPMMDRNLGAIAGFTKSDPPQNQLDMSKANGFHYQWGRKDPFPSSYSADQIDIINNLTSAVPPKGMLNRYGPDGITYIPLRQVASRSTVRNACQHPEIFYMKSNSDKQWCSDASAIPTLWNSPNTTDGQKTFHDPCPAGWRVVSYRHLRSFFTTSPAADGTFGNNGNIANSSTFGTDGGVYFYYTAQGSGEATYIRLTGYWRYTTQFFYIGQKANFWLREYAGDSNYSFYIDGTKSTLDVGLTNRLVPSGCPHYRCIQDRQ